MIVCTTDEIPGMKIVATYGLARGNAIRARHVGNDIGAFFKGIVGGEIHEYTKLMAEVRDPPVPVPKETFSVSPSTTRISSGSIPSISQTSCL